MDQFDKELNDILVEAFRSILKVEEQFIKKTGGISLSISEMHLLEAVGKREEGRTVSDIAEDLDVTLPAVTVAINRMVTKGYAEKTKCEDDGRRVFISLTKLGHKVNMAHKYFHEQMIRDIGDELFQDEKIILMRSINRLNQFFRKKSADFETK